MIELGAIAMGMVEEGDSDRADGSVEQREGRLHQTWQSLSGAAVQLSLHPFE
jgi:hypothetical protein